MPVPQDQHQFIEHFVATCWAPLQLPDASAFAASAQQAVLYGAHEAVLHRHPYVGSEHLLLGALRSDNALARDLARLVDLKQLAREVLKNSSSTVAVDENVVAAAGRRRTEPMSDIVADVSRLVSSEKLVTTPRCRAHLRGAVSIAADQMGPSALVNAEHLALQVLSDPDSVVVRTMVAGQTAAVEAVTQWVDSRVRWGALLELAGDELQQGG